MVSKGVTPDIKRSHWGVGIIKMTELAGGKMIVVTTPSIPGWKVTHVYGIVSGEAIIGANIVRDIFAAVTDIIGGRSGAYEEALSSAKDIALEDMRKMASVMGANAILGCDLDYETPGTMLMVSASGTAVKIEPEN
jgi:uncharacterized protein YbjQ (UPF0145 family)